jgi:hypothetical protein
MVIIETFFARPTSLIPSTAKTGRRMIQRSHPVLTYTDVGPTSVASLIKQSAKQANGCGKESQLAKVGRENRSDYDHQCDKPDPSGQPRLHL